VRQERTPARLSFDDAKGSWIFPGHYKLRHALDTQTLVANVPASGTVILNIEPLQRLLGVGCGAGTNSVTASISWTVPTGTVESNTFTAVNISAKGALDTGETTLQGPVATVIRAKAGTKVT
jgi:hypothetical protein